VHGVWYRLNYTHRQPICSKPSRETQTAYKTLDSN